jgi:cephalosporin hydroxylase
MTMGTTALIFPAGYPGAEEGRVQALGEGRRVIGASSLISDPVRRDYDTWEWLPYVSDPTFETVLATLVRKHDIGVINAPHYVVFHHLEGRLGDIAPGVELRGGATLFDHEKTYRALDDRIAALDRAPFFAPAVPLKPDLSDIVRASLFRQVETISGMSSEEKLQALVDILRCAPPGDIVEVGTWWGKSAAMFVMLAHRFDAGPVLCVDPWASEALHQGDEILDAASAAADMDQAFRIFQINLAPLALGRLNYIRATSASAAAQYEPGLEIHTETFGAVSYSGRIAVLHIDGNHSLEHADEDMRLWTPHVAPGGWIIFDDYFWVFGDGPKQVGDSFLKREAERIQFSFVAGKALFVQLRALSS